MGTRTGALVCLLVAAGAAGGNDGYRAVCRIVVERPDRPEKERRTEQTGFVVVDEPGVYTALHGVSGGPGTRITVIFPPADAGAKGGGLPVRIAAEITKVDVGRDIAFLEPVRQPKQPALPAAALPCARAKALDGYGGASVKAVGHPLGVEVQRDVPLTIREQRPVDSLSEILTPRARAGLAERIVDPVGRKTSPDLGAKFLCVEGNLLPGHSGAPIVTKGGAVMGVGCGGLDRGRVGYGWAVPFQDIDLKPVTDPAVKAQVDQLAKYPPTSEDFAILDDRARQDPKALRLISKVVSPDGDPVRAYTRLPSAELQELLVRLDEILKSMKNKDGKKFDPLAQLAEQERNVVWLPSGTMVELLGDPVKDTAPKMPGLEALPPGLGKLPPGLGKLALPGAGTMFDAKVVDQLWTRVRVPSRKGKDNLPIEAYVPSVSIRTGVIPGSQEDQ